MHQALVNKLHEYIRENNPDLLLQLEGDKRVAEYLTNKINTVSVLLNQTTNIEPTYNIEFACMDLLTQDLRPSKFKYMSNLLQEEFELTYQKLQENGTLKVVIISLIQQCQSLFEDLNFSCKNEDNQFIRYVIVRAIRENLEGVKCSPAMG